MNIALITNDYYPNYGGITHTVMNLSKFIRERQHKIFIINPFHQDENSYKLFDDKNYSKKDVLFILKNKKKIWNNTRVLLNFLTDKRLTFSDRIKFFLFFFQKPEVLLKLSKNFYQIYPLIRKQKIDIFLSANLELDVLLLLQLFTKIFKKSKKVSMAHGNDFLSHHTISTRTILIQKLDKILINSNYMKKLILKIQKLEESRIIQINRALNLSEMTIKESKEQLRKDFQISQEDFIILSIGRLVPRKRFDLVIRAIAKIKKKNPQINLKYFLIGKGRELPKLKDLAEKLSIKEEIKFLGSVSHEIKYRYYKLSDIFVMPSSIEKDSIEGFGIVFLEANYFKLPVIGTLSGGMKEAIIDEKTGFLVEPDDIDKIFEKILFLHDNPNIRKEMGEYGYNRVLKEYNWNIIVNDYEKIFNEIIHNNRK